jgi:hypothetical protein
VVARANQLEKSIAAGRRTLEQDLKRPVAEFNLWIDSTGLGPKPGRHGCLQAGIILCAELDQETARAFLDGASGDLDALILDRPQLAARAEEAKSRLKRAREAIRANNLGGVKIVDHP